MRGSRAWCQRGVNEEYGNRQGGHTERLGAVSLGVKTR